MKTSIIVDVSNLYFGLKTKKLKYDNLVKYCEEHGETLEKKAVVVIDKTKKNIKFISMLKHLGFEVVFVPNKAIAEFTCIELSKESEADLVFLCTSSQVTLYGCKAIANKIFVIGTRIHEEYRKIFKSIEIPPSMINE